MEITVCELKDKQWSTAMSRISDYLLLIVVTNSFFNQFVCVAAFMKQDMYNYIIP